MMNEKIREISARLLKSKAVGWEIILGYIANSEDPRSAMHYCLEIHTGVINHDDARSFIRSLTDNVEAIVRKAEITEQELRDFKEEAIRALGNSSIS
jgi:hypothetical protein